MKSKMIKILPAAFAAAMLTSSCSHATLPTTRVASAPQASKVAKPDSKASKYLNINYVTGNGMFGNNFTIRAGEQLWLRAYVTSSEPNSRVQFNWSGMGVYGYGDNATFNYPFPGNYMINLDVRDERGNRDWRMLNVWVQQRGKGDAKPADADQAEAPVAQPEAPAAE